MAGENEAGPPMMQTIRAFIASEDGATAVEYGIIAAVLSAVIVGASGSIRSALVQTFTNTADGVASVN
jgi:pilus assembly protein Flp/PilA